MSNFCKWPEGCDNYCEGNTDYCGSHNHQMRKEHREASKPQKQYTIPKVSPKMKRELKTYSVKRVEHLRKHPDCQIRLVGCQNNRETNQVHHSAKRSKNLNNEETFLTACIECHKILETKMSAQERREKGYLK